MSDQSCGYEMPDGTLCGKPAIARWDHEMIGPYPFCKEHDARATRRQERKPDPSWQRFSLTC